MVISTFFFSVMLLFSFPYLVESWIDQVIFLLRFWLESHSIVNPYPVFYLKAYLRHTEPFRKKTDGLHVTFLFWGNNRQHRPVCAKTISSWVRKVLCVAEAHISLCSAWEATALAVGVFLVSILQAGDLARVSILARHYFPPTLLLQIGTRILYSILCWPQWVGALLVSVKHWLI